MTILIDPPAWPAHGTYFSHLVSDTSLHELRAFARAAGVPDRALDLDHYDVPAERHDELVAAGAVPVDGRELARRLGASVLRVSGAERGRASRTSLASRWASLCPTTVSPARWSDVGDDLLGRWREPHRAYHTRLHLAQALDALDLLLDDLASAGTPVDAATAWQARVALWFHDAVHDGAAGEDERRSADLVRELLGGGPTSGAAPGSVLGGVLGGAPGGVLGGVLDEVARLVLVTTDHDPAPGDLAGALVSDADLAVLGAAPREYARYAQQVRAEYGHVPDDLFRAGRAAVLQGLLAGGPLFRTAAGAERWQARAEANLRAELLSLSPTPPR